MALRSQSLRIARALSKELNPCARSASSAWRRPVCGHNGTSSFPAQSHSLSSEIYYRNFSTKSEEAAEPQSSDGETASTPPPPADEAAETEASGESSEGTDKIADLESQIKDLKDNLLRSLAEQENTRRIAQRDVANAKSFATSSFAKSLLDTSDNLSRALYAVPEELRHDHENNPTLANLYEGISMTDDGLSKAFAKNGLVKFGEKGEKFDPNLHEALFEYPDPEGEAGNIGQVMKVGFMLNKRVLRPAEVGVVKAP
mmetsp:Transcript_22811/g.39032  ORF Transcript_22811/g.39032 Transcript_22811/m.39032 type:complete len:258 (-) Transcript_22811:228-1001(-)|eukprot:CAMPEP_0183727786 /NCGR_PEP_ID=MMETSP0737-20130205/26405_1 /TAXON_ID=385413 /ORGANISM="Thalassiosira miniscula, Strain CCMP1093" /LENGTH=257 /DNA_ID=CAMNT_0025959513 /DNA_START=37 /DNA_END=810 /DNA_ORIENTATION=-